MDFRFLGPLEVRSEGTPLPLGGHKQRGILAVLLLHANTVVSVDSLVEDVWGPEPPRTVQAYVQNCVSRLRTVLGRERIETHPSGYLLRADPEEVDALRFAWTVEAARSLEAPERVAALSEALALWRGAPLAEFTYEPFAQSEVARLDELRLEALEARLDAELELGRHAAALPELEALAARHPSRERLRYLQMLALYRAGRQRDALAAYQAARSELVEAYGLEPGEALRALERMILSHDPALRERPRLVERVSAPESVMLVVEPVFDEASEIVERTGGTVLANGEMLTVAFGVPHSSDDDALRALRAADALRAANARSRVAIDRAAETLDPALLEGAAPGETILGAGVLPLVAHAVDVVTHPGGGYRVLRVDPEAEAVPRRFDTPFVGRDDDLKRLDDELNMAIESGSVQRLLVLGDAGIGKTRLTREFASRVAARVVTCRFRPYEDADTVETLLAELGPAEELVTGEADAEKIVATVNAPPGRESRWALRRILEAVARAIPLVLVLDDVQWATPDVFDLIDYLLGWAQASFLVIELARPEFADTGHAATAHTLYLESLSASDTATLARALRHDAPEEIVDAADGNPLYVEQLVAWSHEGRDERVPPTIDALIAARIQRLPTAERRALERASVAGVEFWRGAVETADPEGDVAAALMSLARRRLIHPGVSPVEGEDGFRFHHPLIREVVYATLLPNDRGSAHAAIAHSLGPAPDYDALAGHHLEQAALVDPEFADEAARRLGASGLRALARIDAVRASDLLERASHLLPEGAQRRQLEWGFATATKFAGDPSRADVLLESVADRATTAGDELNAARARVEQIWPRLTRGTTTLDEALALLEQATALFDSAGDDFALARALDLRAAVDGAFLLQSVRADEAGRRARVIYARAGATTGPSDARLAAGAYVGPTPVREAIRRCEAILAAAETPVWASFVRPFLAGLYAMDGRFADARAELENAREGRTEFADPVTLATSWALLFAEVEIRDGMLDRAEQALADACARLRAVGDTEWIAINTAKLGEVQAFQGRDGEALDSADAAIAALPPGHLTGYSIAMRVRTIACARTGDVDQALATGREIVTALEPTDALVDRARALSALAVALEAAGSDEAVARRSDALALLQRKGDLAAG
jgi:DNA-binding SARP family transcriptional activator/exonuclease VII small subunit